MVRYHWYHRCPNDVYQNHKRLVYSITDTFFSELVLSITLTNVRQLLHYIQQNVILKMLLKTTEKNVHIHYDTLLQTNEKKLWT